MIDHKGEWLLRLQMTPSTILFPTTFWSMMGCDQDANLHAAGSGTHLLRHTLSQNTLLLTPHAHTHTPTHSKTHSDILIQVLQSHCIVYQLHKELR